MREPAPTLHLPARDIPVPTSVSPEAQAVLAMPALPAPDHPPLDDLDAWRVMIREHDEAIAALMAERTADAPVTTAARDVDGVPVHEIVPDGLEPGDRRLYLDIHGGEFIYGAGECCRAMAVGAATRVGARVWSVDYRMPPDHPFPAGLDDCLTVYRAVLADHRPEEVIVGGASAGGNLAAALLLRARDEGVPLPAAAVLMTPGVDLTASSDSLQTNLGLDPLITTSGSPAFTLYAAGHDLTDPYLSPLYGDFTRGFPPTILTTGTRDMLLSDTVRMHRALRTAGIPADLHVTEAAGHGGFFGMAPEDHELERQVRLFVDGCWSAARS
ncbi:MAG TPA: alpha/beta hydrolase [Acidimicrobiales bacterium]